MAEDRNSPSSHVDLGTVVDIAAVVAAVGGTSLGLGMLYNVVLFFSGGALFFVTTLTIADHIAAAAKVLPLLGLGVGAGLILRALYPLKVPVEKPKQRHRIDWISAGLILAVFVQTLIGSPTDIAFVIGILLLVNWARRCFVAFDKMSITNSIFRMALYILGFSTIMIVMSAAAAGLSVRLDGAGFAKIRMEDSSEITGSVLLIGDRGTIMFRTQGSAVEFVSNSRIASIVPVRGQIGTSRSVSCRLIGWPCFSE